MQKEINLGIFKSKLGISKWLGKIVGISGFWLGSPLRFWSSNTGFNASVLECPPKLILPCYLEETDDAQPKIEADYNFNKGGEEEEKRDDFQSDEPKGETHAGQVRQQECKRAHDPGQHQPAVAFDRAVHQQGGAEREGKKEVSQS